MTDRPKLYPGHAHQWTDADPELFTRSLVRCTVCGFQAPRNAAGLDGHMTECGEIYYGHLNRGEISGMDWSIPRRCNKPAGHDGNHWWDRDKPEQETRTDA